MHHQDHVVFSNLHSSSVILITIKEDTKVSFDSPIFILNKKISNLEMYTDHGRMLTRCFVNGAINSLDAFINEYALNNAHYFP